MKKLCLILSAAILFCTCGIAQKDQKTFFYPSVKNKKGVGRNTSNANQLKKHSTSQSKTLQLLSGYYFESFEGSFPPTGWTKQDPDGGPGWAQTTKGTTPVAGWMSGTQTVPPNGGNKIAYCTWNTGGVASNDQWLISPQFSVISGDSLAFYLSYFGSYTDTLEVRISTAGNSTADFTTVLEIFDTTSFAPMASWHRLAYSLNAYAGQNIYVAFRERATDNVNYGAFFGLDLFTIGTKQNNDIIAETIDMPSVIGVGTIAPMATFQNIGSLPQTFNVTMKITGGYTSTKQITTLTSGSSQQITFDSLHATPGIDTIIVYTQLANDTDKTNDTLSKIMSVVNLVKTYCFVVHAPGDAIAWGPALSYLQIPDTITSIANQDNDYRLYGGTWGLNNKWYGSVATEMNLITFDTITGARTVIGSMGVNMYGLAYDYTSHKLYGVSNDGTNSSLYSISTITGASTLIGVSITDLLINLACDNSGNLYSVGVNSDILYSINKFTGIATPVGSIGFDANYVQGMEFDHKTNTCYMAAYDGNAGSLRTVDLTTGVTNLIAQFKLGCEITAYAIPFSSSLPAFDASVSSVVNPKSECNMTNAESITINIDNLGTSSISNIPVSYSVNGGTPVTETITSTIAAGTSFTYTFTQTTDLSGTGTYIIKIYSALGNDAFKTNDTLKFTFKNIPNSTPPYSMGFEPTEDFSGWTIEDANKDFYTWQIVSSYGQSGPYCLYYFYDWWNNVPPDDWAISKCLYLQASKTYNVSYYYEAGYNGFPEDFNVSLGTAPVSTAMTTQLATYSNVTNDASYLQGNAVFTVPADGTYYIGFHLFNTVVDYGFLLDDISITDVTGIKDNTHNSNVNVFPVPAKDVLNISSTENISNIKMTNVFGQTVYKSTANSNNVTINTSNYTEGIYYIQMQTAKGNVTKNITIQK